MWEYISGSIMGGATSCPNCDARFRITDAQLDSPNGLVRCGQCQQDFDPHSNYISDPSDRQLKLPIMDEPTMAIPSDIVVLQPMTLAEQVAIVPDVIVSTAKSKRRSWPWAIASLILLLGFFAQAAYYFRVDLAAQLPMLKPALVKYCRVLKCTVPLPLNTELISIESSGLEADPARQDQIILHALLRNRAPYAQAFPGLELTLNDTQDKPIARRVFQPRDYLPATENEKTGLLPNHEINLDLHLSTASLKPVGYRLMLVTQAIGQ